MIMIIGYLAVDDNFRFTAAGPGAHWLLLLFVVSGSGDDDEN